MKWRKLGRIFEPPLEGRHPWMNSHAAVPFMGRIDDIWRIYFSSRDQDSRSWTTYIDVDPQTLMIVDLSSTPVLGPGNLGEFDDCGAMGSCIVDIGSEQYLYYIGWNLGGTVPFRNSIGLAVSDGSGGFYRRFSGPIIDRTASEPHFVASNCVIRLHEMFHMWYLSCVGWPLVNGKPRHQYHIKYATSLDGINWVRKGIVAIDFASAEEYAISTPRVIYEAGMFRMWYSYRGRPGCDQYRIGYAESIDGVSWIRRDHLVGIDISTSGWDSEMICYPFVFDFQGQRYMLYNGNGYGMTGFGLAVLERDV